MKQFASSYALHSDVNPFACLKEFEHLDDVRVRYHADNQELISKELFLFSIQLDFVYLLDGADLSCYFVSGIIHIGEFTATNPTDLFINLSR